MTQQPLFNDIDNRVARDKEDGDIAYFHALTLKLEYLTKIVTLGLVACVGDDADRHRYSLEHTLVRTDSIGDWVTTLNTVLVGPPAQLLIPAARDIAKDLTERVGHGDWRHSSVTHLNQAAMALGAVQNLNLGPKVALRQFFDIGAQLRNRSRGHGAPTAAQCNNACPRLDSALSSIVEHLELFRLPWVYLHQNLSGKYRVSPLLNDPLPFEYLKRKSNIERRASTLRFSNGVFFHPTSSHGVQSDPVHIPLIFTDPNVFDVFLPNGNHKANTFEVLSYVTNEVNRKNGAQWSDPPARLPLSETEGSTALEPLGNCFSNAPPQPIDCIQRHDLETSLYDELLDSEKHPIVSLTGPGGIGKTTIAITAIQKVAHRQSPPYEVILWISSRDIDLLESGPKPVSRRVFKQNDISRAAVELLEPKEKQSDDFNPDTFFQQCLTKGAAEVPTLFVLDNFETLQNPVDAFKWIDRYIRLPNKVLITTRHRDFAGDYPITIEGMSDEEADSLVDQRASQLNITHLLDTDYKRALIHESDGHPYVIKILLGKVAKENKAVKLERIVANADDLLKALFDRTFDALSPGGQRIFLLLSSWRVLVPEVAVEAVLLRPGAEKFNATEALEELHRFSFVHPIVSHKDDERFVGVPLAAAMYGRNKLKVSPLRTMVEGDRSLLMEFGAGKREDIHRGVFPRIENLIKSIAARATESIDLANILPVLEYLATRVPKTYLKLADLVLEFNHSQQAQDKAKRYIRSFLETSSGASQWMAWKKLANLCQLSEDPMGEIHALCEAALHPMASQEDLSSYANTLNSRLRSLKPHQPNSALGTVQENLLRVIYEMEQHLHEWSATDCSRLAWLHFNVGNKARALDVAKLGIVKDQSNEHCQKLIMHLET